MSRSTPFILPLREINFGGGDLDLLKGRLSKDNAALFICDVEKPEDLCFTADGLVQGRYSLTTTGAAQFFSELCPGFYGVARHLLSEAAPSQESETVKLVCSLANRLAVHRFSELKNYRLILDKEDNRVDGFVSPSYVFVRNSTVFDYFEMGCEAIKGSPKFFSAQLYGRDLTATFVSKSSKLNRDRRRVQFRQGLSIQNRETSGRAVRAANIVLDEVTRSWSADAFYSDTRVPHVRGAKFRDRLLRMTDALMDRQVKSALLSSRLDAATQKILVRKLEDDTRLKLKKTLIAKGERVGIKAGHVDALLDLIPKKNVRLFDVYAGCLKLADKHRVTNSLPFRQFAFSLLETGTGAK